MCGIFGSFGLIDKVLLKKGTKKLIHRGPDSEGFFIDDNVMLGVRRLKIIDLKTGDQPFFNEDKSIVCVFNGEIYNFRELRKDLENKGHRFYSESDTEVIVHSYEEYGINCANRFNGMFAFAIWDTIKRKMFVFRDRYGVKPLYYYKKEEVFMFSSEIKALLEYKDIPKKFNSGVLGYYFKYRYIKSPDTFIQDIKKLPPGRFIEISKDTVKEGTYYSIMLSKESYNFSNTLVEIDKILEDSINKRLVSDVPVGLFLSGGIDSTSILYYVNKIKSDKIKTFTIGFENDEKTNEFKSAKKVSDFFNTDHHELFVNYKTAIDSINKVIYHLEEPIADATAISNFLLSKFTSKKVKVALSGEGADEVFRGYVYYNNMKKFKAIKKLPDTVRTGGSNLTKYLPNKFFDAFFNYPGGIGDEGKKRLLDLVSKTKTESEAYDSFISLYSNEDVRALLNEKETKKPSYKETKFDSIYNKIFYNDMSGWLPDYILTRVDKMTMASSLECRVPFLDYRLVNYMAKNLKEEHNNKYFLRSIMKSKIPSSILAKNKFPFYIPITTWFNSGLKEHYECLFSNSSLIDNKILDKRAITELIESHESSSLINSRKLWSIMTLELVYKQFIE